MEVGNDTGSIRPIFRSLAIAASGLSAYSARMEVVANNLANAETIRTADGTPYQRRVAELSEVVAPASLRSTPLREIPGTIAADDPTARLGGVEVSGIAVDASEGPLIYDPGHPEANEKGYVRYPNVDITQEMGDMMSARRLYEANASVFQAVKAMLRRAVQL